MCEVWAPTQFQTGVYNNALNLTRAKYPNLTVSVKVHTTYLGGGLGRTPIIGSVIREFLPWQHLLSYTEAIMRVYNQYGRRDNKYKARIKILVKELGTDVFRDKVEAEWQHSKDSLGTLTEAEFQRCKKFFTDPAYETLPNQDAAVDEKLRTDIRFNNWFERKELLKQRILPEKILVLFLMGFFTQVSIALSHLGNDRAVRDTVWLFSLVFFAALSILIAVDDTALSRHFISLAALRDVY